MRHPRPRPRPGCSRQRHFKTHRCVCTRAEHGRGLAQALQSPHAARWPARAERRAVRTGAASPAPHGSACRAASGTSLRPSRRCMQRTGTGPHGPPRANRAAPASRALAHIFLSSNIWPHSAPPRPLHGAHDCSPASNMMRVRQVTGFSNRRNRATSSTKHRNGHRIRCGLTLAYACSFLPCVLRTARGDGRCHEALAVVLQTNARWQCCAGGEAAALRPRRSRASPQH